MADTATKMVFISENDIKDLESEIDRLEKEINQGTYAGRLPEVWVTVKGLVKEIRRLQTRVLWLENERGAKTGDSPNMLNKQEGWIRERT